MTHRPIPVPPGPAWSTVHRLAGQALRALPELKDVLGDVWSVEVPWLRTVVVTDPALIHTVLVRDAKSYRKDFFSRQLTDVLGDGLLLSEGEAWKRNRRLAQPAFHHDALRGYAAAMTSLTAETADAWPARHVTDVHEEMMRLTLRIVARTLFGHEIGPQAEAVGRALDAFMETSLGVMGTGWRLPGWVPTPVNCRHKAALRELDTIVYGLVEEHRRAGADPSTLLGMLLAATDADGGLTDRQLRDESVTLLMAGHETTANALTFALYGLSQHPDAEARLHAELDSVLGERDAGLEDLRLLPYTRAVFLETLRLWPPAWSIGREALVDATLGEYQVPKGAHVWIPQWVVHRDARWFADPLVFRPDRWLDGTLERSLPDGAFFPFGAGSRVCIGKRFAEMEGILVLAALARRRAFRLAEGESLSLSPSITLRPEKGLRMLACRREAAVRRAA